MCVKCGLLWKESGLLSQIGLSKQVAFNTGFTVGTHNVNGINHVLVYGHCHCKKLSIILICCTGASKFLKFSCKNVFSFVHHLLDQVDLFYIDIVIIFYVMNIFFRFYHRIGMNWFMKPTPVRSLYIDREGRVWFWLISSWHRYIASHHQMISGNLDFSWHHIYINWIYITIMQNMSKIYGFDFKNIWIQSAPCIITINNIKHLMILHTTF